VIRGSSREDTQEGGRVEDKSCSEKKKGKTRRRGDKKRAGVARDERDEGRVGKERVLKEEME
jgi:hypothetical protein